MSLIPGSAPSIHFAAALSSPPNVKLLPVAAAQQRRIWRHVASGDQARDEEPSPLTASLLLNQLNTGAVFHAGYLQAANGCKRRTDARTSARLLQLPALGAGISFTGF